MSHSSQRSRNSDGLEFLREQLESIVKDELFEDITFLVLAADIKTGEISITGNACLVCIKDILDTFIDKNNIRNHMHHE